MFSRRDNSRFSPGLRNIGSLSPVYPNMEHRWLVETTSRFLTFSKLVLIDRNRDEMRFIGEKVFTTRYRNKLQVERDFKSRDGVRVTTPYIYGELLRYALQSMEL